MAAEQPALPSREGCGLIANCHGSLGVLQWADESIMRPQAWDRFGSSATSTTLVAKAARCVAGRNTSGVVAMVTSTERMTRGRRLCLSGLVALAATGCLDLSGYSHRASDSNAQGGFAGASGSHPFGAAGAAGQSVRPNGGSSPSTGGSSAHRGGSSNGGGVGPGSYAGVAGDGLGGATTQGGRTAQGGSISFGGSVDRGGGGIAGALTATTGGSVTAGAPTGPGGLSGAAGSSAAGASAGGLSGTAGASAAGSSTAGSSTGGAGPCSVIGATGCSYVPVNPPSCPTTQKLKCNGESCCTAIAMPGATYPMGRTAEDCGSVGCQTGVGYEGCPVGASCDLTNERPEHAATVAAFALDKYEVTVSRFRAFLDAYDQWHGTAGSPKSNEGAHPLVADTGWGASWTATSTDLPVTAAALKSTLACDSYSHNTWTSSVGSNEIYPINCVNWFVAFAFCIWDGGRLPTEAEWEYAAAGGAQNRLYPWGSAAPDANHASYVESTPSGSLFTVVGSKWPTGAGYFGHSDLAGSVAEWIFDWFYTYQYQTGGPCNNCANTVATSDSRVTRGGGWIGAVSLFRAAGRTLSKATDPYHALGFRCARNVP